MNDDYDKHIIQKYRLAVALAIIRNTPEDTEPKLYLERLKTNIIPEMDPFDPDMTICEDDFDFNEDCENDRVIIDINTTNEIKLIDSQTNDSITILKDFDFNDIMRNNENTDMIENNSVSDVLRILKGIGSEELKDRELSSANNITRFDYHELSQNQLRQTDNTVIGNIENNTPELNNIKSHPQKHLINSAENDTFYDSQKTNTYEYTENFTHYSPSQVEPIVLPRHLIEKEKPKDKKSKLPFNQVNETTNINVDETLAKKTRDNKILKDIHGNTDMIISNDKAMRDNKKHKYATQDDKTNAKRSRNVEDKIDSVTEYSFNVTKTKVNNQVISLDPETKLNNNTKSKAIELSGNPLTNKIGYDTFKDSVEKHNTEVIEVDDNIENDKTNNLDNFNSQYSIESSNPIKLAYGSQAFSHFSFELNSESTNEEIAAKNSNSAKQKTIEKVTEESEEETIIEELFDELTDSQAEVVPFKVLEELNRVKLFLTNRCRGSSEHSESGYKSDSQSRSSFKSALQSNIGLNQSAHCLLSYLTTCPLVVNTTDITNEISRTLGRLIDKLHEQEKYPSFLEEHLQTVDRLLKEIYEEESNDKIMLKDQSIQRIFLLNKSSHIIKYTAEKIITILEGILTILKEEEPLEVSRTIQMENLAYIFHVLETLLKKLVVYKNLSQQSTQNSQEDEVILKRSSITDIWRKKWNPSKKCDLEDIGSVKQCVLARCSEVLNKLIVQAMDGYSLISYSALQCFNLLQN